MSTMNRMANAENKYQGPFKRVLCVCSAGVLRSPTAAMVLSQDPFNLNTRAAGIDQDFALVCVDKVLLHWADLVVCMDESHARELRAMGCEKQIVCLDIPDQYAYRDPALVEMIKDRYLARTASLSL